MTNKEAIEILKTIKHEYELWVFGALKVTGNGIEYKKRLDACNKAIEALKKAEEQKWIPCSERLPEDSNKEFYDSVIVTLDSGRVAEGVYRNAEEAWLVDAPDGHHFSEDKTGHVIAWMPLPEPYKEE